MFARANSRVLIIVQNLSVPLDRRVWLECQALVGAGVGVSVICPKGEGDEAYEELDGVHLYRYPPPPQAKGVMGFLLEFAYCWVATALLSLKVWRCDGFGVMQACTPPDTYFALAWLYRPFGVKFVYDQHDLNPELFVSRMGEPRGALRKLLHRALFRLEKGTYDRADRVIATNDSYRRVAMERGGVDPELITVVRSGPNTKLMRPAEPRPELRHGRQHLLVYLGVMGPQDGVDLAIQAMDVLVHRLGRTDCHMALLGFGDCLFDMQQLAKELDLEEYVTFTGRADRRMISDYLSTAELGLCPDPLSPLNDISTMNKTMEYMSYALPVVSFDLQETRVSAGDACVYVKPNDVGLFAKAIAALLDDDERRAELAMQGRRRAASALDWAAQARNYISVYRDLLPVPLQAEPEPEWPFVDRRTRRSLRLRDEWGRQLVDLRDAEAVARFARTRQLWPCVDDLDLQADASSA